MVVKGKTTIKMFLIVFIGIALYLGHKKFFNNLPGKIKDIIPNIEESEKKNIDQVDKKVDSVKEEDIPEMKNFKFSSEDKESLMGGFVSSTLNKILENPKGRVVLKEVLQKMMRQSHEIAQQDLFLSRYLVHDISIGEGKKAMCGDTVEILYAIKPPGDNTKKKEDLKTVVTIGKGVLNTNLENGIINMNEGGSRTIGYPDTLGHLYKSEAQEKKSNVMSANVKLLSIINRRTGKEELGKPFFDKIGEKYSSGIKLICGDEVKGIYSLSDIKGTILYDSKKVGKKFSFKIGEDKIPVELSNALLGLPAYQASVSFVTSSSNIRNAFDEFKNFIPENVLRKKKSEFVILNFKVGLLDKISYTSLDKKQ